MSTLVQLKGNDMWDVKFKRKEHYNCFQNVIYSMSEFYQTTHYMMMLELWGFRYVKDEEGPIGNRLSLPWLGQVDRRGILLEKYHGFGFKVHPRKEFACRVKAALQESPVGFYLDCFWCEWTNYYQIQHREHLVLCLAEDDENYICIDDTCEEDKNIYLDKKFVELHCKNYVTFHKADINNDISNSITIINEISSLIHYMEETDTFSQYENFVDDMVNELDIPEELEDKTNPVSARLFMFMKNIADDRYNFAEALGYIGQEAGLDFAKSKKILLDISYRYEKIRAYLIRCYFLSKKQDINVVNKEFTTILQLEKEIYEDLKSLSGKEYDN